MQAWIALVDALKDRDDVQLAAEVSQWGGPDAVTFLRASPAERAVWVAAMQLRRQSRLESAAAGSE